MESEQNYLKGNYCGVKDQVELLVCDLRRVLYPSIFGPIEKSEDSDTTRLADAKESLMTVLNRLGKNENKNQTIVNKYFDRFPDIKELLETDIEAAYRNDPAAHSKREIMLTYPSFEMMSIHRLAHELYLLDVPVLPRMISEFGHSLTGIDIHPGSQIGSHFFIDHGTGTVVGETAQVGDYVTLYQGVTLGVKSFDKNPDSSLKKGGKRHPNLGDNVTVYANATILGGDTTVGSHSVIGANVWLSESVSAYSLVTYQPTDIKIRKLNKD